MDKDLLFKPSLPEEDVEIPGKGTVRVRALTRAEMHGMNNGKKNPDAADIERRSVVAGLMDPELTYDEVCRWYEVASVSEIQPVVKAIMRLSGLGEESDKDAYKSVRDES